MLGELSANCAAGSWSPLFAVEGLPCTALFLLPKYRAGHMGRKKFFELVAKTIRSWLREADGKAGSYSNCSYMCVCVFI